MKGRVYSKTYTPAGDIYIVIENGILSALYIGEEDFLEGEDVLSLKLDPSDSLIKRCTNQLEEYFEGHRKEFDIPIEPHGTEFQKAVWKELCLIPFGETRSYQDIAFKIGREKAVRAIGQANKANRLPIIIPCHRVIGKNKSLTGYAGNRTEIKEVLLALEGSNYIK
ncbi:MULTISPECIES: methylated-DNA--[protein]-cysteine S-methyltransferase [Cytobacillus]|jgi:methylated-DNA-[protein]-cysteine S-methyltransferase|uniref:Methylated-DNA--protein-cysteine methyltransferase n=1 Tax=Cytobacillus oceanisediminis 2691 TaxID=1196031 RepID=A0A160M938_9BACI|nr:methylated-DNA--[protein]-cysteine S-methyltransferase [Cytobacillus oceanisediminis]MCS0823122.1 methylated-DNA--[protein]-cysteine S-methyltransferase [Cytobacillus firmus]AND39140.1 cysteine methyltransferase [Cytobacillus oceanisediminis 2691]MBU8733643.1 methylated-DNA--[protein]-cysteine S-methyltransferase [Cytobacillus oceanisediminis]MCM3241603.1 methylated-DNA--[protein]-cysteine S-methyltransferase [Cytobacillus oceanisediminis]MCM3528253.1 methylated-DNA--[protein]-cysteine S-me